MTELVNSVNIMANQHCQNTGQANVGHSVTNEGRRKPFRYLGKSKYLHIISSFYIFFLVMFHFSCCSLVVEKGFNHP